LEIEKLGDAAAFRRMADPLLLEQEARNNLILGVTGTVITTPGRFDQFDAWLVWNEGDVVGAAARTPPHNLILADARSDEAVRHLAHHVGVVPGVIGIEPWVSIFVGERPEAAGSMMSQGVFQLDTVIPPSPSDGVARPGRNEEEDLLAGWAAAFQEEALGEPNAEGARRIVERNLTGPPNDVGLWVYEVGGEPRSTSSYGGATPNGIRVNLVYTPPEHRGKGYASNLVAAQSQWLLENGRRFCFLYTDLANPTSNAIYQRIGYRQVAESADYRFA
jgi:GNAT superfamily N-acetyltransferase